MPPSLDKTLALFSQLEEHYRLLEEEINQFKKTIPFYSAMPEVLLKQIKQQKRTLDILKQEIFLQSKPQLTGISHTFVLNKKSPRAD